MSTCWTILLTDPIDFSIVDLCEMIDIPFFRKRTDDAAFKRGHMYKVNSNEPSRFSVTSIKQTTLSKALAQLANDSISIQWAVPQTSTICS